MNRRIGILLLGTALTLASGEAQALCSSPAGNAGDITYSSIQNIMVYCNGTSWISMGTSSPVGFGALTAGDFCLATSGTNLSCTTPTVSLISQVSGVLTVPSGGTGDGALTAHGVMLGNGTGAVNVSAAGASNTVLIGNGAGADPSFSATPTLAGLTVAGSASLTPGSDVTSTGSQNNVALGSASTVRYNGSAAATFTGIAAGSSGQLLYLHNPSSFILTLSDQNASSQAGNRIVTGTSADLAIPSQTSLTLQYDGTAALWRVLGASNAAKAMAGGSDTQVQYNNAGAIAGSSGLTFSSASTRLGVGTSSPAAALDVTGNIYSRSVNAGSATAIDWSQGNSQYTSASCGAFTLSNLQDGGTYTLAVEGATSGTCSFTQSGLTFKMPSNHGATTASTMTVYAFARVGSYVFVSWTPGY